MAGEIAVKLASGLTDVKACVVGQDANYVWDELGGVLTMWSNINLVNWQSGLIPLTEKTLLGGTATGVYVGNFSLPGAGKYTIFIYRGAIPSPADTLQVPAFTFEWTGAAEVVPADASTALSTATWTGAKAGYIDAAISSRSSHSAADVVTAFGTGSTLTAVPWNAAWDAEVQSECTDALNAYDPPTNAEMEARTLAAASYATAANQTTILGYVDCLPATWVVPLDAAGVRTAVGLGSANLDTQLADMPTVAEFNARTVATASYALEATLTAIKGATWSVVTDTLEAIRDRGDAAWITATGFSTHSAADVAALILATPANKLATDGSGYVTLAAAGMNAVLVDGKPLPQALQIIAASVSGIVSGAGSGTETFLGLDETTPRLIFTCDTAGNRTGVTYG